MEKENQRKRAGKLMADMELGIGCSSSRDTALKQAFDYALKRWCRHPEQRKRFLNAYTCIAPGTEGPFPAPRYRSCDGHWKYPGQQTLFHKYDPAENSHTVVIELRVPK